MFKKMFILLFFSHCFAQEETNFDFDPSSQDGRNLEDILRKLIAVLNKNINERIFNIEADIEKMKEILVRNEGKITKNYDTIGDFYSYAERNSAHITSMSEQYETMILNNIHRLNSLDNKIVDMKVKIISNHLLNLQNSNTISTVNSVVKEHSALITSVSKEVEQQQTMILNNIQRLNSMTRNLTGERNSTQIPGPRENLRPEGENGAQDVEGEPGQVGNEVDRGEPRLAEHEENMGIPGRNGSQVDSGLAVTTSLPSSLADQGTRDMLGSLLDHIFFSIFVVKCQMVLFHPTRRSILGSDCIDSYFDALNAL